MPTPTLDDTLREMIVEYNGPLPIVDALARLIGKGQDSPAWLVLAATLRTAADTLELAYETEIQSSIDKANG
jgi:hypothetical protein